MGNSGADNGTQASHVAKGKLQQIRMALHLNKKPNSQKIVSSVFDGGGINLLVGGAEILTSNFC